VWISGGWESQLGRKKLVRGHCLRISNGEGRKELELESWAGVWEGKSIYGINGVTMQVSRKRRGTVISAPSTEAGSVLSYASFPKSDSQGRFSSCQPYYYVVDFS